MIPLALGGLQHSGSPHWVVSPGVYCVSQCMSDIWRIRLTGADWGEGKGRGREVEGGRERGRGREGERKE